MVSKSSWKRLDLDAVGSLRLLGAGKAPEHGGEGCERVGGSIKGSRGIKRMGWRRWETRLVAILVE